MKFLDAKTTVTTTIVAELQWLDARGRTGRAQHDPTRTKDVRRHVEQGQNAALSKERRGRLFHTETYQVAVWCQSRHVKAKVAACQRGGENAVSRHCFDPHCCWALPLLVDDFEFVSPVLPLFWSLPRGSAPKGFIYIRFAPRAAYAARYARSGRKSRRSGQKVDDCIYI